jgi:hypothetical protein
LAKGAESEMGKRAPRKRRDDAIVNILPEWEKELLLDKSRQCITVFNQELLRNVKKKSRSKKK